MGNNKVNGITSSADKMRLKGKFALLLTLAIVFSSAEPACAQMSVDQLKARILRTRLLPKTAAISVTRDGDRITVEVRNYPSDKANDMKIDAILIARHLVEADPSGIKTVLTRYPQTSNAQTYSEIIVSNKEIVGAGAGAIDRDELLDGVILIDIKAQDNARGKCAKYVDAAAQELDRQGLHEAEYLLGKATQILPGALSDCAPYGRTMLRLADAYRMRGDTEEEERVYKGMADAIGRMQSLPADLSAARKVRKHYIRQKEFETAEGLSATIVRLQENASSPKPKDLASDLIALATCQRNLGKNEPAKQGIEKALKLSKSLEPKDNKLTAQLLEELGDCYSAANNSGRALELYREAKNIYDMAAASRVQAERIPYVIYRSNVGRLTNKIKGIGTN